MFKSFISIPIISNNYIIITKKVTHVQFNPTSTFVLASGSADSTVRIWNAQKPDAENYIIHGNDYILSLDWNENGSLLGTAWKDKKLRIIDPRQKTVAQEVVGHEGPKSQKFIFMPKTNYAVSVGFAKTFDRQYYQWDMRAFEKP